MKYSPHYLSRFLFFKIPIAWLAGVRPVEISDKQTVLRLRYGRFNRNPFGSIYFAVLLMGGELVTGIPLFKCIDERKANISMLVVRNESVFLKKAKGTIRFVFDENEQIRQALEQLQKPGDQVRFTLHSRAVNEGGEIVAEFRFEWSLKKRS